MHANVLEATKQEILRIMDGQQATYGKLLDSPIWSDNNRGDQKRSVDSKDLKLWLQIIKEERYKVERLETTLAVVGPMKAGKSTTINAIVGSEILPNRNNPMTTLPTLIRHKPSQTEPKLSFAKPEPFNKALQRIKNTISGLDKANPAALNRMRSTDEMQDVSEWNAIAFRRR